MTAVALVALTGDARAFEVETPVTNGCHEVLTREAAAAAGFPDFAMAPPATDEQRRAMNDLVFDLPREDPWSLALMIGVRSNDLGDRAPTDLEGLFHVHDDPATQDSHCIRRQEDDGPQGDVGALAACRAFILGELEAGGLLEDTVDFAAAEKVSSFFRFRGQYEIGLPRFAYRLGRAVHAIQDAYTHSMRDAATGNVRHVLNYIDAVGSSDYDEAEDGYIHITAIDDCKRDDAHQRLRIDRARQTTADLFAALSDTASGRRQRVTTVIDAALVLIPGCDASNRYCDAPELDEPTDMPRFGCATSSPNGLGGIVLVILAIVLVRRRRVAPIVALVLLVSATAFAQDPTPPADPPPTEPAPAPQPTPAPPPTETTPPVAPTTETPSQTGPEAEAIEDVDSRDIWHTDHWHFDARVGGSIDNPAVGGMIGIGRTQERWNFGFLAEWNPWFSFDRASVRAGVFNAYLTLSYRWFQGTRLTLATRIEAGSSTMLFELLGVDKYATGIYLGGALTTIRFPLTHDVALTFDPIHFAIPTPRPFGIPFYYKQYRVTFGIEVRL